MDTFHTGLLIRTLIVLVTLAVLVIAGLILARREQRRASNLPGEQPTNAAIGRTALAQGHRYTDQAELLEANDADASVPPAQKRAA